uniref:Uncharacterized protein n=1 Tax=Chaetoceros debilis TaxID=122233 RepID=A0A7S3Q7A8_9STRA|mmetsp:Transcript_25693/g.39365  ORF Transcript_25693/g.39365 Transcript_25693/m.39365 type:complete len:103 (+) Transcript_25693:1089-1397(+)
MRNDAWEQLSPSFALKDCIHFRRNISFQLIIIIIINRNIFFWHITIGLIIDAILSGYFEFEQMCTSSESLDHLLWPYTAPDQHTYRSDESILAKVSDRRSIV